MSTSAVADAAKKPAALLAALLEVKVTSLPHGYKTPRHGAYQVPAGAKNHHALGGVRDRGHGGNEGVIYIVFLSAADARLDWQDANLTNAHLSAAPKEIPRPALVANASTTARRWTTTVRIGLTEVACLVENAIVQGVTSSTTNAGQGDVPGAVELEPFALEHLKSVR